MGKRKPKKKHGRIPTIPKHRQNDFGDYVCYFDGACEPKNPGGNMGVGAVIFKDGIAIYEESVYYPAKNENSNNVAEYLAFIYLLEYLIFNYLTDKKIVIYGDSNLVVRQMTGDWRIHEGWYVEYANEAKQLLANFSNISLYWIPREENEFADKLSKKCMIDNNCEFKIQPL